MESSGGDYPRRKTCSLRLLYSRKDQRPTSWPLSEPKSRNGGFTDISAFTGEEREPGGWAVPNDRIGTIRLDRPGRLQGVPGGGERTRPNQKLEMAVLPTFPTFPVRAEIFRKAHRQGRWAAYFMFSLLKGPRPRAVGRAGPLEGATRCGRTARVPSAPGGGTPRSCDLREKIARTLSLRQLRTLLAVCKACQEVAEGSRTSRSYFAKEIFCLQNISVDFQRGKKKRAFSSAKTAKSAIFALFASFSLPQIRPRPKRHLFPKSVIFDTFWKTRLKHH